MRPRDEVTPLISLKISAASGGDLTLSDQVVLLVKLFISPLRISFNPTYAHNNRYCESNQVKQTKNWC